MNIAEPDTLLLHTRRDDWVNPSPPLFASRGVQGRAGPERLDTHTDRGVLKAHIDVALEWGMTRGVEGKDETHLWAEQAAFANPSAHTLSADVFCRGDLIDHFFLVDVDGGRAYVPSPRNRRADREGLMERLEEAVWSWSVSYRTQMLAAVVNNIDRKNLDEYL